MPKLLVASAIALAALTFSPLTRAQTGAPAQGGGGRGGQGAARPAKGTANENIHLDGWNKPQGPIQATGKKPGACARP